MDELSQHVADSPILGPGIHPQVADRFSYVVGDHLVHMHSGAVGDPFAAGLRTWDDPMLSALLPGVRNHLSPSLSFLLPWALTTVSAYSPGSLGLFAPAGYSGPRATGLVGNLRHRTRADAFAAELIVAACLACRCWDNAERWSLGGLRRGSGRLDFGVKLLTETRGRSTVEADILLTDTEGRRHAVDVKYSPVIYRSRPTPAVLVVVEQALRRGEIASFTFATPTRFRPVVHRAVAGRSGVHLLENVWPSAQDRDRIVLRQQQAVDYGRLIRRYQRLDDLIGAACVEIASAYSHAYSSDALAVVRDDVTTLLVDDAILSNGVARTVARWRDVTSVPAAAVVDFVRGETTSARSNPAATMRGDPPGSVLTRYVYDDMSNEPAAVEHLISTRSGASFVRTEARPSLL